MDVMVNICMVAATTSLPNQPPLCVCTNIFNKQRTAELHNCCLCWIRWKSTTFWFWASWCRPPGSLTMSQLETGVKEVCKAPLSPADPPATWAQINRKITNGWMWLRRQGVRSSRGPVVSHRSTCQNVLVNIAWCLRLFLGWARWKDAGMNHLERLFTPKCQTIAVSMFEPDEDDKPLVDTLYHQQQYLELKMAHFKDQAAQPRKQQKFFAPNKIYEVKLPKCFYLFVPCGTKELHKHFSRAFWTHPVTDSVWKHQWPKYADGCHTYIVPSEIKGPSQREWQMRLLWNATQLKTILMESFLEVQATCSFYCGINYTVILVRFAWHSCN